MKVTIYTINNSPFCVSAKNYLTSKGIAYDEKDVEQNKDSLHEMLTLSDHFTGVPYTYIVKDDGTTVGLKGFTEAEFDAIFVVNAPAMPSVQVPTTDANQSISQDVAPMPISDTPAPSISAEQPGTSTPNVDQNVIHEDEPATNQAPMVDPAVSMGAPATPTQTIDDTSKQELGSIMDSLMQKAQTETPTEDSPVTTSTSIDAPQTVNNVGDNLSVQPAEIAPVEDNVTRVDSDLSSQMPVGSDQATVRTPLASTPTIPDFPK